MLVRSSSIDDLDRMAGPSTADFAAPCQYNE